MVRKITTPRDCTVEIINTVNELTFDLKSAYPEISEAIEEIAALVSTEAQMKFCFALESSPGVEFTSRAIHNFIYNRFLTYLTNYLLTYDKSRRIDPQYLISHYRDVLIAIKVLPHLAMTYAESYPDSLKAAISALAFENRIPATTVSYILRAAKEESLSRSEYVAILLIILYVLMEYSDLPADIVDNYSFYLSELEPSHSVFIMYKMPLSLLIPAFPLMLSRTLSFAQAIALMTGDIDLMNFIFNFALVDRYTITSLDILNKLEVIPDERYEEAIHYLIHLKDVATNISRSTRLISFAELYTEEMTKLAPNRMKERLRKTLRTYSGKLAGVASELNKVATNTLNCLSTIMTKVSNYVKSMHTLHSIMLEAAEYLKLANVYNSFPERYSKVIEKELEIASKAKYTYAFYYNYIINLIDISYKILHRVQI